MILPEKLPVPSGRIYERSDLLLLVEAADRRCIEYLAEPVRLRNGNPTQVYVFFRGDLTDSPILLDRVGRRSARTIRDYVEKIGETRQVNLIGFPTAGTPIAVAASMASVALRSDYSDFPLIACRTMREKLKTTHGAGGGWVNGERNEKPDVTKFFFGSVDNVVTDAGTKIEGAEHLQQDGYPAHDDMLHYALVDRQQGGLKRMRDAGFKHVLMEYNLLDITHVYSELKLWPPEAVRQVEDEIRAYQFA